MELRSRRLRPTDAEAASALVRLSFGALVAHDWSPEACDVFLGDSSPARMREKLEWCAFAEGMFAAPAAAGAAADALVAMLLMPDPAVLSMLFVHPDWLRRGLGRTLWDSARAHVETHHPAVTTVSLNATPCAVRFYRSLGFAPISAEFVRDGCRVTRMACWLPARSLGATLRPE
jgi:GNAT superfamily N-acetyltransferase